MEHYHLAWRQRIINAVASTLEFFNPSLLTDALRKLGGSVDELVDAYEMARGDATMPDRYRMSKATCRLMLSSANLTCAPPPIERNDSMPIHLFGDSATQSYNSARNKSPMALTEVSRLGKNPAWEDVNMETWKGATLSHVLGWLRALVVKIEASGDDVSNHCVVVIWQGSEWTTALKKEEGGCRAYTGQQVDCAHEIAKVLQISDTATCRTSCQHGGISCRRSSISTARRSQRYGNSTASCRLDSLCVLRWLCRSVSPSGRTVTRQPVATRGTHGVSQDTPTSVSFGIDG